MLEVEELGDRLQVGEAGADGLGADTVKATLQVETRCDGIDGKVDRHFDGVGEFERVRELVESTRVEECFKFGLKGEVSRSPTTEFLCCM